MGLFDAISTAYWRYFKAALITVIWITSAPGRCDTLVLRDNRQVSGNISGETADSVTIDSESGRFTFKRDRILQVTRESTSLNSLRRMGHILAQGKLDEALLYFLQQNLESHTSPETFNGLFMEKLADSAGAVRCSSATATVLAGKFSKSLHPPPDLLIFAGALCADTGNFETAQAVLKQALMPSQLRTSWPANTLTLLMNRIVDVGIRQHRGELIALSTSIAARLPGSAAGKTDYLSVYANIERLMRNGEVLQAVVAFQPELFLHRADLFTPLAERLLSSLEKLPDGPAPLAALESARVTLLPYVSQELRKSSMHLLVNRLVANNRQADAQQLADDTSAVDPDLGADLQHLVEYHQKLSRIATDAPLELYNLAGWARSMGLLNEAHALFTRLKSDPRFSENAGLQLKIIETATAEKALSNLRRLFDEQKPDELKTAASDFIKSSPPDGYAQQARDLIQLADFQKWSGKRSSSGKAEAEYQQAERLFSRREYDAATLYLNRIQASGGDSNVSAKAQLLRDKIIQVQKSDAAFEAIAPRPTKPPGSAP